MVSLNGELSFKLTRTILSKTPLDKFINDTILSLKELNGG